MVAGWCMETIVAYRGLRIFQLTGREWGGYKFTTYESIRKSSNASMLAWCGRCDDGGDDLGRCGVRWG